MKIRLTELCEFGEAGDVLEPDMPDIANLLIQRGVGVPHETNGLEPADTGEPRCDHLDPWPSVKPERRTRKSSNVNSRR